MSPVEGRGTYLDYLDQQCERLMWFAVLVGLVVFVPYIPVDMEMYPDRVGIVVLRLVYSVTSLILLLVLSAWQFRYRGVILGSIYLIVIEGVVGALTGLTGADPIYSTGYMLVLMLIPLAPLPRPVLYAALGLSLLAFVSTTFAVGPRETGLRAAYARNDFITAAVVISGLIFLLGAWRIRSWRRSDALVVATARADRALEETRSLSALVRRINERRALGPVVWDLFDYLSEHFPINEIILMRVDHVANEIVAAADFSLEAPRSAQYFAARLRFPLSRAAGSLWDALGQEHVLCIEKGDQGDEPTALFRSSPSDRGLLAALELEGLVVLPLRMQNEGIGLLLLADTNTPFRPDTPARDLLERISHQVAPALHTALLLEELRSERQNVKQARMEVEYLNQVTRRISEASSLTEAMTIVQEHLRERFGVLHFSLSRMNPDQSELVLLPESLTSVTPEVRAELQSVRIPVGAKDSIHGRVCAARRTVFFKHVRPGSLMVPEEVRVLQLFQMRSVLFVPLVRANEVIGVMTCTNGPERMNLSHADVEALGLFADHVAGLVHNFALLGEARTAREKSEELRGDLVRLHSFARDLNALSRYTQVVDAIESYAAWAFPSSLLWIIRVDEEAGLFLREKERAVGSVAPVSSLPLKLPIDRSAGLVFQAYRRRRMVHIIKTKGGATLSGAMERQLIGERGVENLLYAPMISQDRVVGLLGLSGIERGSLRDTARIHLEAFCEQAASAMQRTLLSEKEEGQRRRMEKVGQMAAGIIHDLKNPMTTIKGYAELSDSDVGPERRRRYLESISREVDHLTAMCYELLEFAGGRHQLQLGNYPIDELIADVLASRQDVFEQNGVRAEVALEGGCALDLDRSRMRRVISNLVNNAVEALALVETHRRLLSITGNPAGTHYELRIRDTGPGIPGELRSRLFEPFATSGKQGGTGLGLSIVKGTVEAHGGTIDFESEPGAWTEFVLRLPVNRATAGPERRRDADRRQGERRSRANDSRSDGSEADGPPQTTESARAEAG